MITIADLTVVVLEDLARSNMSANDLMASGMDAERSIIIGQPRFVRFLERRGHSTPPFTQQQRNDFMLVSSTRSFTSPIHGLAILETPATSPSKKPAPGG